MKTTLSFVALLLSSASLFAQADRTFQTKYEAGRTWVVSSKRVLDLDLTITDLDGQKTSRQVKADIQEKHEREFQRVEGGRPTQIRVKVLEDRRSAQPGPLEGKEVLIDGSGANGPGLTQEQKALFRLEADFESILPERSVAVGAKWNLNHQEVARFVLDEFSIMPSAEGSAACELKSVEMKGDHEVAQIRVDLNLNGRTKDGWEMKATGSATLTWDLTNGRPEKLEVYGRLDAKGDEKDEKGTTVATVDGRGILTIINTYEAR